MTRIRELLSVDGPTLAAMAVVVLRVEAGFRVAGHRLSGDVAHLDRMAEIVETLDRAPGVEVLFVGNSLIGEGLDPEALAAALSDSIQAPVGVEVIRPDGSTPLEWYYLLDRYVFDTGRLPDLLVVPFGPGHLFDREGREAVLRLAAHHVATDEIPELLADDLPGFEARSQFALARLSRAFALRDRVQPRVLDLLIPDYRELAPLILRAGEGAGGEIAGGDAGGSGAARARTLDEMRRLQRRADAAGVPVLYLAMPESRQWEISPEVRALVAGRTPALLDFRAALALPPERFYDGQHMDANGRERFTQRLSTEMLPTVRRLVGEAGG